jgi:hypothetical protein
MSIDQERVGNVLTHYTRLIKVNLINVVHEIDTLTLGLGIRLHNPKRFLSFLVLLFMEETKIVCKLIWETESLRSDVEGFPSELLLHPDDIHTELIFPGDLIRGREVIDLLVLIESIIEIRLHDHRHPEYVPVVSFCIMESMGFQSRSDEFTFALDELVAELSVSLVRRFAIVRSRERTSDELCIFNGDEINDLSIRPTSIHFRAVAVIGELAGGC